MKKTMKSAKPATPVTPAFPVPALVMPNVPDHFAENDLLTLTPDAPAVGQQFCADGTLTTITAYDAATGRYYVSEVKYYKTDHQLLSGNSCLIYAFQNFAKRLSETRVEPTQADLDAIARDLGTPAPQRMTVDPSIMPLPTRDHTCEECGHEWNDASNTCPRCGGASLF